jgi:hypothetical protein
VRSPINAHPSAKNGSALTYQRYLKRALPYQSALLNDFTSTIQVNLLFRCRIAVESAHCRFHVDACSTSLAGPPPPGFQPLHTQAHRPDYANMRKWQQLKLGWDRRWAMPHTAEGVTIRVRQLRNLERSFPGLDFNRIFKNS